MIPSAIQPVRTFCCSMLHYWFVCAHVPVFPQQQQAAAANEPPGRPAIMSAWTLGDSKRLWHSLTKPLSIKYTEAEQTLDMQLTYINNSDFQVRGHTYRW
jgi:hypothetical protein